MSRRRDLTLDQLRDVAWPASRVAEALQALASAAGLAIRVSEGLATAADPTSETLPDWIETIAEQTGIDVDQAFVALDEIDTLLKTGTPLLLRLRAIEGAPFLAVLGSSRGSVRALGSDRQQHRIDTRSVVAAIRRPFEASVESDVDGVVARLNIGPRASQRARSALIDDRLKSARFRGCWILRNSAAASFGQAAHDSRLRRRLVTLVGAYVLQYALFVMSWWLLGRGILNGTLERGWLLGWLLLLMSLIPVRLVTTWNQGAAVAAAGVWLRRRLLRGASRINRQKLKRKGAGQLFAVVVEAGAIDSLALSGGVVATFALIELAIAAAILLAGATILTAMSLIVWTTIVIGLGWRYFKRRRMWTAERMKMSEQLLESMVGHRTRLMQQPEREWHEREDEALDQYIATGNQMDAASIWLTLAPRGWLVVALTTLVAALARGETAAPLAISIGGSLLAYRALQRMVAGFANLAGAVIAARSLKPIADSVAIPEQAGVASAVFPSSEQRSSREGIVAQARALTFRYRSEAEPVLDNCSLTIPRRARLLLEGASGSGKTTFASIVAGLESPDSGLLLVDGLDRGALGAAGWRNRVTLAPQAHDNFVLGASLAFNLLMGRRWPAQPSDLVDAETICRELGLGELLDRLPAGLHQVVGETGWRLSQGERTRIFLARALLQQPELLVLDESFSALDSENVERAMRCVANRAPAVLAIAHI